MALTNRALAFATRWFDDATVRRVFEPLIADWQREWQDAQPRQRRRVSLRGIRAFVLAVMVSSPQIIVTSAPGVTNRVASRVTRVTSVLTLVLMIPPSC